MKIPVSPVAVRIAIFAFAFIGFVLTAVVANSCTFLQISYKTTIYTVYGTNLIGFFSQASEIGLCVPYATDKYPAPHKAAKAMAVLASLFSFFACALMLCMPCIQWLPVVWHMCSAFLGIAFLAEVMTFVFFNDPSCKVPENICTTGPGAAVAIAACAFLLSSFIASALMFPPTQVMFELDFSEIISAQSKTQQENTSQQPVGIDSVVENQELSRKATEQHVELELTIESQELSEKATKRIIEIDSEEKMSE